MCKKNSECRFPMCVCEQVEWLCTNIFYFIMWIVYTVFNPGLSLTEFIARGYKSSEKLEIDKDATEETLNILLSEKKDEYDRELERNKSVGEKTRALLPVASALLLIVAFVFKDKLNDFSSQPYLVSLIVLQLIVIITGILLVLMQYGTYKYETPIIQGKDIGKVPMPKEIKAHLITLYHGAIFSMDGVANYQVNLQRAAKRAIIIESILLLTSIIYTILTS